MLVFSCKKEESVTETSSTEENLNNSSSDNETATCYDGFHTEVVEVTNLVTGKIWMDRNLGATQVSSSITNNVGYYYQWGRSTDGHQVSSSGTTSTVSSTELTQDGLFIAANYIDWLSPQNTSLWQGSSGLNNPCPCGFRLPTKQEWEEEVASWSSQDSEGGYNSVLKLPNNGYRSGVYGFTNSVGVTGLYWSSSTASNKSYLLETEPSNQIASLFLEDRINGLGVRCIKN